MRNDTRKLAAVLFADIVGYTSLMQTNEQLALAALKKFKTQLDQQVPNHNGEIINFYGDGCLAIFNSSVDATACAKSLQLSFQSEPKVPVRIGLHAGDVVLRDDNVFGYAVNIASRIESMGVSGSVLLSSTVWNQIKNQEAFDASPIGKFEFKNVEGAMTVYALNNEGLVIPKKEALKGKQKTRTRTKNKRIIALLVGVLLLSISGFFFYNSLAKPSEELIENNKKVSIALLPLEDSSLNEGMKYLG
jgi:class 3 adenylate cyclase